MAKQQYVAVHERKSFATQLKERTQGLQQGTGPGSLYEKLRGRLYKVNIDEVELYVAEGDIRNDAFREPPLTYLIAEFGPYTYERATRPSYGGRVNALGSDSLPIPIIALPWDHLPNPWEFVYLAHEVAHDLEGDLKLGEPLGAALLGELNKPDEKTGAVVPADRVACWKTWQREVFADLVALRQVGPAYAEGWPTSCSCRRARWSRGRRPGSTRRSTFAS